MEATIGFETIFSAADEKKLVEHVSSILKIRSGLSLILFIVSIVDFSL
jgi:hypothetical protein